MPTPLSGVSSGNASSPGPTTPNAPNLRSQAGRSLLCTGRSRGGLDDSLKPCSHTQTAAQAAPRRQPLGRLPIIHRLALR